MLRILILLPLLSVTMGVEKCSKKKVTGEVYKARLEVKAMCMNYTIKLLEGKIDSTKIVANWTDATTMTSYTNVFALKNPCNFPDSIKQGDEFYFVIDAPATEPCMVCMIYYPIPGRKLPIKVVNR